MRGRTRLAALLGVLSLAVAYAAAPARAIAAQTPGASARQSWNFIDKLGLPSERQDAMTKQVVERLATGVVKTAAEARFRPFEPRMASRGVASRFLKGDEVPYVTGLFFVETGTLNLDGLAQQTRDLVWEVTVIGGLDVRSVFYISARAGVVSQVFP